MLPPRGALGASCRMTNLSKENNPFNTLFVGRAFLHGRSLSEQPSPSDVSTAGGGGFWGPGLCENMHEWSDELVGQVTIVATSNEVRVRQFILQSSFTISRITTVLGDGPYSATFNFGIYSASGSLLLDSGAFNGSYSAIGTVQTLTITPVTLAAGTYFYAQTASSCSVSPLGVGSFASQLIVADSIANATTPRFAIAANAASGGALLPRWGP